MSRVIGIDLGTGNSCVATIENGKAVVITNSEGGRTTPSIVSLKNGERKVGESAKRQHVVNPKETVSNIKRFMGVEYDKCNEVMKHISYDVVNKDGKPRVNIDGREYSPEEISSFILQKMKQTAEDYIGGEVKDAVITCPAWFDNSARQATELAGQMCGLNVLRIINEPTAAILSSDIDTKNGSKIVLVADFGCGTADFSVCEVSDGMIEVLASKGDVFLGGSDFDNAISDWVLSLIKEEHGIDLSKDPQALQRILEASEKAKIELSTSTTTDINLPYIAIKDGNPIHLDKTLTRAKMEAITKSLIDRFIECGSLAMRAADVKYSDLDSVLLVGGQTRSVAVKEALKNEFKAPLNCSVNPDEAVACGAAIQANIIVGGDGSKDMLLLDVTPVAIGIETMGGVFTKLVEANTTIPCRKENVFSTAVDNQTSVNIIVLQGERPMAKDNKVIGEFVLDGIMPARKGIPQILVKFDITANGTLKVSAVDKATNKEQHITIETKGSLTQDEIERIKKEAEEFAEKDKKEREIADTINKGDSLVYQNEKMIEDYNDKLSDNDSSELKTLVEKMKDAVKDKDVDMINKTEKEIMEKWNGISSKIYSSADGQENENAKVNTDEADFEEVN